MDIDINIYDERGSEDMNVYFPGQMKDIYLKVILINEEKCGIGYQMLQALHQS